MSSAPLELFVACAPGLEDMLAAELAAAGLAGRPVAGGVEVDGDLDAVYRCNLEAGLGLRVLARLARFRASNWNQLIAGVAAVDWRPWIDRAGDVRVKATASKSRLYHTGGIAQRVRVGVESALGGALQAREGAAVTPVTVRLVRDECTVSIDTTGDSLSRRGYRLASGKAPLREDLARALVIASGWDRATPLADPMCGSGTLAIEAAILAANRAPGAGRRFAFMDAPGFEADRWQALVDAARGRERTDLPAILASDRDAGVVSMARDNATRAGVTIDVAHAPLSAAPVFVEPPARGTLVCNPPYGARVGGRDLRPLYQRLGQLVRERLAGWRVALVVDDPGRARATGLPLTSALMTDHGGRKVYFLVAE